MKSDGLTQFEADNTLVVSKVACDKTAILIGYYYPNADVIEIMLYCFAINFVVSNPINPLYNHFSFSSVDSFSN